MAATPDLAHFLQRRDLLAYEQRVARAVYAYGVDLRRAAWLQSSRIGDPAMRGVDRRWNTTTAALTELLQPAGSPPPTPILEELARLIRLLRAPLPSVRVLRAELPAPWPIATPLGTTSSGSHWLVLDAERLLQASATERAFVLGWALGHLQCDHGPLFAAHLMAHRAGRTLGAVGLVLKPWARVATFSADRAAMLAVGSLEGALEGLPLAHSPDVPWLPSGPDLQARRRALEDFARSSVMARLRVLTEAGRPEWSLGTPKVGAMGAMTERLSHIFGAAARASSRAAWLVAGGADPQRDAPSAPKTPETDGAGPTPAANEAPADPPLPSDPVDQDPELRARLTAALADTWSIARCDQILTRRLRLL